MTQNSQLETSSSRQSISDALAGARVKRGQSSLDSFALIFEDGRGLLINAVQDEDECGISLKLLDASQIEPPSEAVCAVDWSWIYGQSLLPGGVKESSGVNGAAVKLTLTVVGTITVAAGSWQGKPFLSFMPYKASK